MAWETEAEREGHMIFQEVTVTGVVVVFKQA